MIDNRGDYGDITVIYGARSPKDLCYTYEFQEWRDGGVNLILTVDAEFPGWKERVGFVPTVLNEVAPSPNNRIAVVCGPPIMIKFVLFGLKELGLRRSADNHHVGKTDEVRHRNLRPLQCRLEVCVPRWTGFQL